MQDQAQCVGLLVPCLVPLSWDIPSMSAADILVLLPCKRMRVLLARLSSLGMNALAVTLCKRVRTRREYAMI